MIRRQPEAFLNCVVLSYPEVLLEGLTAGSAIEKCVTRVSRFRHFGFQQFGC